MDDYLRRWLILALNDLRSARHEASLPEDEMVTSSVCFHSQQAAEKFLKAYLVARGVSFGRTHNIQHLIRLCSKEDPEFSSVKAGRLTYYAVQARYPDEFYIPTVDEAREALRLAEGIKDFVLMKLGVSEEEIA